jgi:hypothetical protein
MQTVLDVDERLLNLAERQARRDGKSLGALVEDALRAVLHAPESLPNASEDTADSVEADDAFFTALEEIRALGRLPAAHRQVNLQ